MPCLFVILVDNTIQVISTRKWSLLDYENTMQFIRRIGDVGEAKMVYRNHVVNNQLVTSSDVTNLISFNI